MCYNIQYYLLQLGVKKDFQARMIYFFCFWEQIKTNPKNH